MASLTRLQHQWGNSYCDSYLGIPQKMHLPSIQDMVDLITVAGLGCFLYSHEITRAYHQLPLNPADWPLVCFVVEGQFYANISLPFGLC